MRASQCAEELRILAQRFTAAISHCFDCVLQPLRYCFRLFQRSVQPLSEAAIGPVHPRDFTRHALALASILRAQNFSNAVAYREGLHVDEAETDHRRNGIAARR